MHNWQLLKEDSACEISHSAIWLVSQSVSCAVRRCVVVWSGARTSVVLLFIVLELYSLVCCSCEPAEALFSLCDVFEHTV
jgi:hypothetical protein